MDCGSEGCRFSGPGQEKRELRSRSPRAASRKPSAVSGKPSSVAKVILTE